MVQNEQGTQICPISVSLRILLEFFGKTRCLSTEFAILLGCKNGFLLDVKMGDLSDKEGKQNQNIQKERLLITSLEDPDLASGHRYLKCSET